MDDIAESVVAVANTQCGVTLIGVNDKGQIKGCFLPLPYISPDPVVGARQQSGINRADGHVNTAALVIARSVL